MLEIRHCMLNIPGQEDSFNPPLCSLFLEGAFLFGLIQRFQIRSVLMSPQTLTPSSIVVLGPVSITPEIDFSFEPYGLERQDEEIMLFSGIEQGERKEVVRVPFVTWETAVRTLADSLAERGIREGSTSLLPRPAAEILDELWDGEDHKQITVLESHDFHPRKGTYEEGILFWNLLGMFDELVSELTEAWGPQAWEQQAFKDQEKGQNEELSEEVGPDEEDSEWYEVLSFAFWRREDHFAYVSLEQEETDQPYLFIGVRDTL